MLDKLKLKHLKHHVRKLIKQIFKVIFSNELKLNNLKFSKFNRKYENNYLKISFNYKYFSYV